MLSTTLYRVQQRNGTNDFHSAIVSRIHCVVMKTIVFRNWRKQATTEKYFWRGSRTWSRTKFTFQLVKNCIYVFYAWMCVCVCVFACRPNWVLSFTDTTNDDDISVEAIIFLFSLTLLSTAFFCRFLLAVFTLSICLTMDIFFHDYFLLTFLCSFVRSLVNIVAVANICRRHFSELNKSIICVRQAEHRNRTFITFSNQTLWLFSFALLVKAYSCVFALSEIEELQYIRNSFRGRQSYENVQYNWHTNSDRKMKTNSKLTTKRRSCFHFVQFSVRCWCARHAQHFFPSTALNATERRFGFLFVGSFLFFVPNSFRQFDVKALRFSFAVVVQHISWTLGSAMACVCSRFVFTNGNEIHGREQNVISKSKSNWKLTIGNFSLFLRSFVHCSHPISWVFLFFFSTCEQTQ